MAFIFRTYYKNGRKYAKINKETILVETSVQDRIKEICFNNFKKFRIQFYKSPKVMFMLYLPKNENTSLFEENLEQAFGRSVYYDIIRTK